MNSYRIFRPQYFKKFECIGAKCKNTCCQNWHIIIDKSTYDKYMHLAGELGEELRGKIKLTREEPFLAEFVLGEDGHCQMLSGDGLCRLQLQLGHGALCRTCRVYPRKFIDVGGETEAFLTMSCEAAARAALFSPDIMRLEAGMLESDEALLFDKRLDTSGYSVYGDGLDLFWKLRTASVVILQSRQYALWLRMVILGLFVKQADELLREGRREALLLLSDEFTKRLETGFYDTLGGQLQDRYDLKIGFILEIFAGLSARKMDLLGEYLRQAREGLGAGAEERTLSQLTDRFVEAREKYYRPFFDSKEYVLEHYIVNLVFMSGFPLNYESPEEVLKNYTELAVKYSLIKFMLVGMSGYHRRGFDKRRVLEGISAFSRPFDHGNIVKHVTEYLEKSNAGTVGALSMLMKD